jgi:branched-subunit amino acid aminotransferase/4-amino-4-deoxychorismate lyase
MSRVGYVDGQYVPHRSAAVHIEDRGYGDGVYEVLAVVGGHLVDEAFLTSTTVDLLPVVRIDGDPVAGGTPGPLSRRLRDCYLAHTAAAEGPL